MSEIDIIIPIKNEKEIILPLLSEIKKKLQFKYSILICFDNENDDTIEIIKNSISYDQNIKFIKNNLSGPNHAILTGIKNSNSNCILIYMADDLLNIELINDMYKKILSGYSLIIPSRFIKGGTFKNKNIFKKIITYIGFNLVFYLGGVPYKDCTNAFKMFSKELKNNINFKSTKGFTYALELTIKSYYKNYKIYEIPAKWEDEKNRKSKFKLIRWLPFYLYWFLYSVLLNFKIIKIN